jgi:hypothetical protein
MSRLAFEVESVEGPVVKRSSRLEPLIVGPRRENTSGVEIKSCNALTRDELFRR